MRGSLRQKEQLLLVALKKQQYEAGIVLLECLEAMMCMAAAPHAISYKKAEFFLKEIDRFRNGDRSTSERSSLNVLDSWAEGIAELWIAIRHEIAMAKHGERTKGCLKISLRQ